MADNTEILTAYRDVLESMVGKLSMELYECQQLLSRINTLVDGKPAAHRIQETISSAISEYQRKAAESLN